MKPTTRLITRRCFLTINMLGLFITTFLFAQNPSYEAIRLNNGNPIIEPSMFSNSSDGDNINGPSLIRIPDWIPANERADASAQYYLYFAHHTGDYIRMAWAANIEGPYTLYDDFSTPGDRGVLDNDESDIILGNNIVIEENHLASPDVIVDDVNQQIIMYFHSGSSFFVNGTEVSSQVSWVSTSPYGLEFYNGIEPVQFGDSYFRVFDYNGDVYALDNGSKINRALDGANPWAVPVGHDFTSHLWDVNPNHVFQDDIPVPTSDLRVRHTGVHVVGNELQAFYSRRGEFQERIQLSTVDMTPDWTLWDPTYPPIEILAPNPGWEGGERTLDNSETSAGVDVNQLRDPDVFEDSDGQLYLIYTGNGEGGLGIAKLYETPTEDTILTTTADAHVREDSSSNFGTLNNLTASRGPSGAGDHRTIYMRFDLTNVIAVEHAVVRLYANQTQSGTSVLDAGGPITAYETSNSWVETSINNTNAPALGDPITTTYLTDANQYYDWNITEYAQANVGLEITIAFDIAPSNTISHRFDSVDQVGGNPGQLLLVTSNTPTDNIDPTITCPADITQVEDSGANGAIITYTAPVGTDNLPGATTVQTQGLASGSLFPLGSTTNTFVVTDAAGNTAFCSFNVTVTQTPSGCSTLIDENNFDSSWGIWNDGGSDCRRSATDGAYANGGTGRCVRLRDNSSTSVTTTDPLDLSSYTEIDVDFNYYARLVEPGEDFWLQISTDGGSSYQTVADWDAEDEFVNEVRYFETVNIQGPFPTDTRLRFRMDASANTDHVYIDDVKILGCLDPNAKPANIKVEDIIDTKSEPLALKVYPNPFEDKFTLKILGHDGQSAVNVELFSLLGNGLITKKVYNQSEINFKHSSLASGVYILKVSYNGKSLTKRMVKLD